MKEKTRERPVAVAGDRVRLDGRAAGRASAAPPESPAVEHERAELIRFQHNRLGASVKMIAAVMSMTQAQVRAVLSPPPPPLVEPDLSGGRAARPSVPTEPVVPVRARVGRTEPAREHEAKVSVAAPHATASGYVPIMSDAYRRRPA